MDLEGFMTKKDVKRIFLRHKKSYKKLFVWAFSLVLFFRLIEAPLYKANATFRYAAQGQEQSDLLRSFIQNNRISSGKEGGAQSVLESRTLLRQVVEELGLMLEGPKPFFLVRWIQSAKDKIYAELGLKTPDRRLFTFSHVSLAEGHSPHFFLRFTETDVFEVYDADKKKIGVGTPGLPVEFLGNTFTLTKAKPVLKGHFYKISATSWFNCVKGVKSQLKVKPNKTEKSIFSLAFSHPCADVSSVFLNSLMSAYREYLKKENEEMASTQMQYLEKRQTELIQKYEKSLDAHAAFLHQGLKETGFIHLKQEKDFLERPSEECLIRLHEVDLKLSRLMKNAPLFGQGYIKQASLICPSNPPLQGVTPEVAEKLCTEYNQQWDLLRMNIEQLTRIQKQIDLPGFEITSLGGVLTDSVSQEMIQKAGRIAIELQDVSNHSIKDQERMQNSLDAQKRFISQHLMQLIETDKLKARLLKEKIFSLQDTSARLLKIEKDVITGQLASLQHKMQNLPEKWKRENRLTMQKDLSLGMLEGLAQLTESKNVHHQLFYVESKPIDQAYTPAKPAREFIIIQGLLIGVILCFFMGMKDCITWMSKGIAVTEDSASKLGIAFCGFLPLRFQEALSSLNGESKEVLRKAAAFISSQKKEEKGVCVAMLSPTSSFSSAVSSLLHLQGLKVLLIQCTPSLLKKEVGLYDFLLGEMTLSLCQTEGFDLITSGGYEGHFVELLFRKKFSALVNDYKTTYDVVILSLDTKPSDAVMVRIEALVDGIVIHAEDVFYDQVKTDKKVAVILG